MTSGNVAELSIPTAKPLPAEDLIPVAKPVYHRMLTPTAEPVCPTAEPETVDTFHSLSVASALGFQRIGNLEIKIIGREEAAGGVTRYAVKITGPNGSHVVHRRYEAFEELHGEMFGEEVGTLCRSLSMPPKSFWRSRFSPKFQAEREGRLAQIASAAVSFAADAELKDCPPHLCKFLGLNELVSETHLIEASPRAPSKGSEQEEFPGPQDSFAMTCSAEPTPRSLKEQPVESLGHRIDGFWLHEGCRVAEITDSHVHWLEEDITTPLVPVSLGVWSTEVDSEHFQVEALWQKDVLQLRWSDGEVWDQEAPTLARPTLEEDRRAAEAAAKGAEEKCIVAEKHAQRELAAEPVAKVAEEEHIATEKRAEEERLAAEAAAKAFEEERIAVEKADRERRAAEAKAAEEERIAAEKKAEEERLAAEAKAAEEERIAAKKKAEEERLAAQAAFQERIALEKADEERRAAEAKAAEEKRIAAEKRAEEERLAAEAKVAEEERIAAEKRAEEERLAAEAAAEAAEERIAAQKKADEERRAAETAAKVVEEVQRAKAVEEDRVEAEKIEVDAQSGSRKVKLLPSVGTWYQKLPPVSVIEASFCTNDVEVHSGARNVKLLSSVGNWYQKLPPVSVIEASFGTNDVEVHSGARSVKLLPSVGTWYQKLPPVSVIEGAFCTNDVEVHSEARSVKLLPSVGTWYQELPSSLVVEAGNFTKEAAVHSEAQNVKLLPSVGIWYREVPPVPLIEAADCKKEVDVYSGERNVKLLPSVGTWYQEVSPRASQALSAETPCQTAPLHVQPPSDAEADGRASNEAAPEAAKAAGDGRSLRKALQSMKISTPPLLKEVSLGNRVRVRSMKNTPQESTCSPGTLLNRGRRGIIVLHHGDEIPWKVMFYDDCAPTNDWFDNDELEPDSEMLVGDRVLVRKTGSTLGTKTNGGRRGEIVLKAGDELNLKVQFSDDLLPRADWFNTEELAYLDFPRAAIPELPAVAVEEDEQDQLTEGGETNGGKEDKDCVLPAAEIAAVVVERDAEDQKKTEREEDNEEVHQKENDTDCREAPSKEDAQEVKGAEHIPDFCKDAPVESEEVILAHDNEKQEGRAPSPDVADSSVANKFDFYLRQIEAKVKHQVEEVKMIEPKHIGRTPVICTVATLAVVAAGFAWWKARHGRV